jgi:flagellar biogenesis protein FliO
VTGRRKRTVVILATILLAGSGLLAASAAASKNSAGAEKPGQETKLLFAKDPNVPQQRGNGVTSAELFVKMMLSVLLVVALGVAAVYISRKVLPRINNLPGKQICILETAHLGPRKAVHLVKVGAQKLLIGSTHESITTLANVTDALTDVPVPDMNALERT